jgi:large repetitive protein
MIGFAWRSPSPRSSGARARWALVAIAGLGAGAALAGQGCSSTPPPPEETSAARQPIVGGVADPNIAAANQVVNRYTALAADAAAGATTLNVASAAALNAATGDLLFVAQMQGATVDGSNTAAFGSVTALNGAGSFEMVTVQGVAGNQITLSPGCGLVHGYSAAAHAQVVWVPQYATLTVRAAGSIIAPAWNGATGGVVVVQANAVALAGAIDVSGTGFRGGALVNLATDPVTTGFAFRSTDGNAGGEKGESIAGFEADYDVAAIGGRFSLGAIANGGGGGAAHNGGGGGGANGDNGSTWLGAGVMPDGGTVAAPWQSAWALDPDAIDAGGPTRSSGGGRGGYSFSLNAQNPLTVAPGNAAWAGDDRQYRGGLGGRPLANDALTRVFLGGGGGAGNENNANGGAGGRGGGIVYVVAGSVTGAGTVRADGATGASTTGGGRDGPGGGGGGGTIVLVSPTVAATVAFSANGGAGGIQTITGFANEAEGPGGGGGGGFIAVGPGAVAATPAGGAGGTTTSPAMTAFNRNGATDGALGRTASLAGSAQPPMCIAADLAVTMTDGGGNVTAGGNVTYTIVVTNNGPNGATGTQVSDPFGAAFVATTWTCTGAACPAASGSGNLSAVLGTLAPGASATFTVVGTVALTATGTLTNTVTVTAPAGITDGTPANNTVTVTNPLIPAVADVSIALTHAPAGVIVGSAYTYTLTVSNAGPSPTSPVTATITLPAGATPGTTTAPGWTCGAVVAQTLTCTNPSVAAGGSSTITQGVTAPAALGTATATATVAAVIGGTHNATDSTQLLCGVDSDCGSTAWCSGAGACVPKASNGQPVPGAGPINGVCTPANGLRACVTGACDVNGNVCGIQAGDGTCTTTAQCIAGTCASGGICQLPGGDGGGGDGGAIDAAAGDGGDSGAGDSGTNDASAAEGGAPDGGAADGGATDGAADANGGDGAAADSGPNDGGKEAAAGDGGPADAAVADAADAGDAAANDASPDQGAFLEGGGCSCNTAGSAREAGMPGGIFAVFALFGILVTRGRRSRAGRDR